ncbi:hypothetical protein [Nostoc sp. UCD121]|uniref:hypothetical protein n=1 Tax=Nostoc sp. UCD121 TaxID=2681305 RepID=UPI0016282B3F|nr:hypothetical protein [Nostoc sp. UCD121]MBC1222839.1 hypothetical protein [Nostoc sp. UCD120]
MQWQELIKPVRSPGQRAKFGFCHSSVFHTLIVEYPSIQQLIHTLLSQDLHEYATRIAWEQMRIQALQSYIQPVPSETSILRSFKISDIFKDVYMSDYFR